LSLNVVIYIGKKKMNLLIGLLISIFLVFFSVGLVCILGFNARLSVLFAKRAFPITTSFPFSLVAMPNLHQSPRRKNKYH